MKFLLLALLSCICSANDQHLKSTKQWTRKIDVTKTENISHILPLNRHVDSMLDTVIKLHNHDDRIYFLSADNNFRNADTKLHYSIRHQRHQFQSIEQNNHVTITWPVKKEAIVEGDLVLGGLMMVHEREDTVTCGPVMPQGGVQALEAMLYTLDILNKREIVPGVKIGAHILDDCDKDTYGLEMAVDFIKGMYVSIY